MAKFKVKPLTGVTMICKICNVEKDTSLFPFRNARKGRAARVDDNRCKQCLKSIYAEWYNKNRLSQLDKMKSYYKSHKEKQADLNKKNYIENKERYNKQSKEWRAANPHATTAHVRHYNLSKSKRTPLWSNKKAINKFYINCPNGKSIDHIHPLHGKLISGLHVLRNLQYLTRSENSEKSNKFNTYWVFYEPSRIRVETSGAKASIYTIDR